MAKKILITKNQAKQFNKMLNALNRIKSYDSINKLRKSSETEWGLEFSEALEMAYENIQIEAKDGAKSIKPINLMSYE